MRPHLLTSTAGRALVDFATSLTIRRPDFGAAPELYGVGDTIELTLRSRATSRRYRASVNFAPGAALSAPAASWARSPPHAPPDGTIRDKSELLAKLFAIAAPGAASRNYSRFAPLLVTPSFTLHAPIDRARRDVVLSVRGFKRHLAIADDFDAMGRGWPRRLARLGAHGVRRRRPHRRARRHPRVRDARAPRAPRLRADARARPVPPRGRCVATSCAPAPAPRVVAPAVGPTRAWYRARCCRASARDGQRRRRLRQRLALRTGSSTASAPTPRARGCSSRRRRPRRRRRQRRRPERVRRAARAARRPIVPISERSARRDGRRQPPRKARRPADRRVVNALDGELGIAALAARLPPARAGGDDSAFGRSPAGGRAARRRAGAQVAVHAVGDRQTQRRGAGGERRAPRPLCAAHRRQLRAVQRCARRQRWRRSGCPSSGGRAWSGLVRSRWGCSLGRSR